MAKRATTKKKKPTAPKHLEARVKKLQGRLQSDDMDGLIISNPHDIRYLTGFVGEEDLGSGDDNDIVAVTSGLKLSF